MRVLVTGGSGFLGLHVARALRDSGEEVTVFDSAHCAEPGIAYQSGDLLDAEGLQRAARGMQAIVHLGAIGDVYLAAEDPALACRVNVVGSANIADAALAAGARVVNASTWEVYGEPAYQPLDERHRTLDCGACHQPWPLRGGGEAIRYRPLGTECADCHIGSSARGEG